MLLLIFGLLSILGNCIVICKNVIALKKRSNLPKEIRIYNALVLNLAISDLLMGIYLVAAGIELQHKIELDVYFSEITFCNALGVIQFVSSQVSLTLLVIISFYRLQSVKYPFKQPRLRIAIGLVATTWVVWIIIAFIPTFNFEPLVSIFTWGIRFKKTHPNKNAIYFYKIRSLLNKVLKNSFETSQLRQVLKAIMEYPTIDVLIKTVDRFGLSQYEPSWSTMGFYDLQYLCSMNHMANSEFPAMRTLFVFCVVTYNLLCSICVIFVYAIILNNFCQNQRKGNRSQMKGLRSKNNGISQKPYNHKQYAENQRMFRLIAIVVATDIACWIPICLISIILYKQFDFYSPCEHVIAFNYAQLYTSWVVVANSIVNPYIYSFHFWKSLFVRLKLWVFSYKTTN